MSLEKPLPNQEDLLNPEMIEVLKQRFEQIKAKLIEENIKKANKADKIESENLRKMVKARLGLIPVQAAQITQDLAELEASLN